METNSTFDFKEIFTKIMRSKTLIFNWSAEAGIALAAGALVYFPTMEGKIEPIWYFAGMLLITTVNKLIRAKTDTALKNK